LIPARRSPLFEAWFGRTVEGRLRASFSSLRLAGAEHVVAASTSPILLFGNHSSWWDALVMFHLSRHFGLEGHAMMDAANLQRLPFFALIGAFGVDMRDARGRAGSLRYAVKLLDRPRRMVLLFPQGTERPFTARPLGFRPGTAEISRLCPRAAAVPFALRYEHGAEERPRIYVRFGAPIASSRDSTALRERHEAAVTELLDAIDRDLCAGDESAYAPLFVAPRTDDSLATRALAWLTSGAVAPAREADDA
jgi:1-acyl-sn-glycerol-3-phosphate acyltransferase